MAVKKAKKKGQVKKQVKKLPEDNSIQVAREVLKQGHNSGEAEKKVIEYRKANKLPLSATLVTKAVHQANKMLASEFGKDKSHVISLHIERYNQEIIRLLETENPFETEYEIEQEIISRAGSKNKSPEDIQQLVNDMIAHVFGEERDYVALAKLKPQLINTYYTVLQTILAKERVLQMHTKGFQISIVNRLNVEVKEEKKYNLDALTFEERVDALNLVLKCKKTDEEVGSVILRTENKAEETIDILHEVIEDVPNIERIKHEEKPLPPQSKDDMGYHDVSFKLAETLRKKAQEAFEKAGSKVVTK